MRIEIQVPEWSALVMLEVAFRDSHLGLVVGIYSQRQFDFIGSPHDEALISWKGGVKFQ